ncbi:phage tail sheath C-terminal domain-containing protein [Geodermatophilus sp. SYSU D01176]
MSIAGVVLGAPGVYLAPPVPQPRTATEPMDVAAFVGVAPRGPAYEPVSDPSLVGEGVRLAPSVAVPVDSWDEYQELFGGFDGPGLLPHAVAAYFAQGARRAYVVRIVRRVPRGRVARPPGCARYLLPGGLALRSRNEGTWGNRLAIRLRFVPRTLAARIRPGARLPRHAVPGAVVVPAPGSAVPVGALLRLRVPGRADALAVVARLERVPRPGTGGRDLVAVLDRVVAPPGDDDAAAAAVVELVEGELTVLDGDPERPRRERFAGLGLQPAHPRFLPDVVERESRLLAPLPGTPRGYEPAPDLGDWASGPPEVRGRDRWRFVREEDLFAGARGEETAGTEGVEALLDVPEPASVVVPDLYAPADAPVRVAPPPVPGSPDFRVCGDTAGRPPAPAPTRRDLRRLDGLALDPTTCAGFEQVVRRQGRLVEVAERLGLVALLDVPPGVRAPEVLRWRSAFDSSYAAGYHPWLRVPGPDPAGPLERLPPSAVAAGILARCELRAGISRGPANELAAGVVDVLDRVEEPAHGELHRAGVDVFRVGPGGVWLTGARTLSADPRLRQLTVRRLLSMLQRTVRRQLAWTVFEPMGDALRAGLRRHLEQLLGDLADGGAFAGATPQESWFVDVGHPEAEGPGRLLVRVGVAPSEPLEFLVLRVVLDARGAIEADLDVGRGQGVPT